jgi:O-antigen/teichoic acid export membrane protein
MLLKMIQILSLIQLKPINTLTHEGRSIERLRRVYLTGFSSVIAKSVNTLAMLFVVPITLTHLGSERFGLWMAITSLVAFLEFADLGIANVILNLVSEANAKDDKGAARVYISNAFFMLTWVSLAIAFVFAFLHSQIWWDHFFNVSSPLAKSEAGAAVAIFVGCFILNIPLAIIPKIQMGYQEGYLSNVWQATSNVIGFVAIIAAVHLEAGLPALVLVIAGFPLIANIMNGIALFFFQRPWLFPRKRDLNGPIAKKILRIGCLFLILQATNSVIYSSDNIIIVKMLSPEDVTNYSVSSRLFTIVPNVLYMFLGPLWPAFAEANSRGDEAWLKKTLIKAIMASIIICVISSSFIILFGEKILEMWVGPRVIFSMGLMIGFGIWSVLSSVITSIALFLYAVNKMWFQVIFAVMTAFLSTIAKIAFAGAIGLQGVVWGNILVSVLIMLVPYIIYLAIRFRKSNNILSFK